MTELGTALHSWLDAVDTVNGLDWYQHVVSRDFACGCKPFKTYCPDWQAIKNPAPKFGTFWVHWNSGPIDEATLEREAKRRKYVLLNAWESGIAAKLKAYNPNLVTLVYKDASSTRSYDTNTNYGLLPAGVSYQWANANRPSWFLRSSSGRLQYSGYSGHWQMDVGNADYQAEWTKNVIAGSRGKFDGVLIDNCLWRRDDYHAGVYPVNYADDTTFRAAYQRFLSTVGSQLRAAGLLAFGNLTNARRVFGGWPLYMQYLDGGWDEWWLTFSDSNVLPEYTEGWRRVVEEIVYCEANGKAALVQPHFSAGSSGDKAFRYALASYLCAAGSKSAFTECNVQDDYDDPTQWRAEYGWNLGAPLNFNYSQYSPNVYYRRFELGIAVVNANASGSVTVPLPGGPYVDSIGEQASSVWLPAKSGAVYRKAV